MNIQEFILKLKKVKQTGDGYIACCPAHNDKTPSLSLKQTTDGRILLHCFAGCSQEAILSSLGLTTQDLLPISHQIIKNEPISVYPYHDQYGELLFEVCRFKPKTFRIRHYKNGQIIWGLGNIEPVLYCLPEVLNAISQGKTVYLCEGEKDCNCLRSLGLTATTAPMGAGKWKDTYTENLHGASFVTLLPDNDEPGRRHAALISSHLQKAGIPHSIKALWLADPLLAEHGDVSDFLERHPLSYLLSIPDCPAESLNDQITTPTDDIKQQILPDSLNTYLKKFFLFDLKRFASYPLISTGFPSLDLFLDGRLLPGLYVLGAISSLGKTAFCGQLCDTLAAQGHHILFFTLEMPIFEMATRSLIRTLFTSDVTQYAELTTTSLLQNKLSENDITQVLHLIKDTAQKITYIEGNFNLGVHEIRQYCKTHYCSVGQPLVVFVDYLQVLAPLSKHMTDKQVTDQNIVELKRISRDLQLPIIAISSLNRQNYYNEMNFTAFKESGSIEYSADFVMGLQARGISNAIENIGTDEKRLSKQIAKIVKDAKNQIPRPLEAVVLKNRRGPAQGIFALRYWPGQNYFEESV